METVKKKRGRKPKNFFNENIEIVAEKKKRGRKKKYEIENHYKIINRNEVNNFNHNIVYSDDEENSKVEESSTRKIAFGNLDITVSKKVLIENKFKFNFNEKITINEDEYTDEELEVPIESFIKKNEKNYNEVKTYIPKIISECKEVSTLKNFKVITTIKNFNFDKIPDTTDICCWWCCHQFDTAPCTCPIDCKRDKLNQDKFDCIGIFCSWNCVKAYHYYIVDYKKKYNSMSLINQLMIQLYGATITLSTKPAPPRQCLQMFGGYMDIITFRKNNTISI